MLRRFSRWVLVALAVVVGVVTAVLFTLRPPPPLIAERQDIILAGVTVVNPGVGRREGQRIAIRGSTIDAISPDVRGEAATHRYPGAYVLPGLIDMDVHHPAARAVMDTQLFSLLYLAYGVTTVRDTGNFDGSVLKTRQQILDGQFAGPRIFACGPIIDGDPPVWPGSRVVHTPAEAERAVDEIAATGVHCIKSYQNLGAEALRGVRAAASRHHLPLVGHVPFAVGLEEAHLDDVQHLTGIGSTAAAAVGATSAELIGTLLRSWTRVEESQIRLAARISVEQRLVHTPTIVVIDRLTRLGEYPKLLVEPAAQLLPRYYREVFWRPVGLSGIADGGWPDGRVVRATFRTAVRQLREAGVTLHVGTDVLNPLRGARHGDARGAAELCRVWVHTRRGVGGGNTGKRGGSPHAFARHDRARRAGRSAGSS